MSNSGVALRFISGKYKDGEFILPADREIVIGRGGELDIVLVEDMVSRKHAKINTSDGKIVIADLGSTNGTFVNGEKIKKAPLKEGDRVLIGTSILKVIGAENSAATNSGEDNLNQILRDAAKKSDGQQTAMSGSLEDVAVPDLLQLFTTSRKSGVLSITNGEDSGRVYIREGQIYFAEYNAVGEVAPMKAIIRMMGWEQGEFRMGPASDESFDLEIEENSGSVIMEAARQLDEFRRLADDLPELEDMLRVPRPLEAPLSHLGPDELEVFQLALNHEFFSPVLDNSPYSDLKTGQIVLKLVNESYLRF